MGIYLQPSYLRGQLPNNSGLLWSRSVTASTQPNQSSEVENLITAIARRVYSDGTRKPVELAVKQFLRLTDRQIRKEDPLQEQELNKRMDFLRLITSEDFLNREGYKYSDKDICFKLSGEYVAFSDIYERSPHRCKAQQFVKLIKANAPADAHIPNSFKSRVAIITVLNNPTLAHIISDMSEFIEGKIPGVFNLFDKLGEEYNSDNLVGLSFELKLAKALQRKGFKIVELSHRYRLEEDMAFPRHLDREIDIVAEKDGKRFYVEAKNKSSRGSTNQLVSIIKYSRMTENVTPIMVVNQEGQDIRRDNVGGRLWRVKQSVGENSLRVWDRNLVDVTDSIPLIPGSES